MDISATIGPTKMVHPSKFAEFHEETIWHVPIQKTKTKTKTKTKSMKQILFLCS